MLSPPLKGGMTIMGFFVENHMAKSMKESRRVCNRRFLLKVIRLLNNEKLLVANKAPILHLNDQFFYFPT